MISPKLIRDKIPEIIAASGGTAEFRTLSQEEYALYLEAKLDEEVGEFHRDHNAEELADILEVVYALADFIGVSKEQLLQTYRKKHNARGGFEKRLLLISLEKAK